MVVFFNVAYIYCNFALCMNLDNFANKIKFNILSKSPQAVCIKRLFNCNGNIIK